MLSVVLATSAGFAAPSEPLVLNWQVPPGCPDGSTVEREVLQLAQLTPGTGHRVVAQGRIRVLSGSFHLQLNAELGGIAGQREFSGTSCRGVTDAAVLTLALMLNPDARPESVRSEPERASDQEPAPESEPPPEGPAPRASARTETSSRATTPSEHESRYSARWPLRLFGGASGGVRTGVLPDVGLEVGLGAVMAAGPVSAALAGQVTLPDSGPMPESSEASVELWLLSVGALAGWQFSVATVGVGTHAGLDWTRAAGRGEGISDPEQANIHWLSAQMGATAMLSVSEHVAVGSGVFGLVPLARPGFTVEGVGEVYRPQPVGIRAYVGVFLKTP